MSCPEIDLEYDFEYAFKFVKKTERFDRLWDMKSIARQSLKDWLTATDISHENAEICANACSELIENCIKYSSEDSNAVVYIKVSDRSISVETINTSEEEHKNIIAEGINKLNSVSDPKKLFAERLMNPVTGKSQLGLIKILMETKGVLELVREPNRGIIRLRLEMEAK
ncbi:MAG: hypothetical protein GY795_50145 [Desulfobacterales bacterium]|nr:hypothetical protein [Desulfobacterales bacterium]